MVQNPPPGYQRVIPYILYDDAESAIKFLIDAFGFEERFRLPMGEGMIGHAEVVIYDHVIMLASVPPQEGYSSQSKLPARSQMISVYVDDVDAHHEIAKAAGANILEGPADQFYGDRRYRVQDPEGNEWVFTQHIKDVKPEDMVPPEC